jgi:hypothetical protein
MTIIFLFRLDGKKARRQDCLRHWWGGFLAARFKFRVSAYDDISAGF